MRDIRLDNITDVAAASFAGLPDARQRELAQELVRHLHAYARKVQLNHAEWRAALAFLHRCGDISSDSRSEFSLLSDVTGLSSLVDLLASKPGSTPGSVLGPFHTLGSPWLDNPARLIGDNTGQPVLLKGTVCDDQGRALPNATIDFWQNASNGMYWQQDPQQPSDNLRCQLRVDAEAAFEISTVRPVPYPIPTDGPVWTDLVQPAGRGAWRPAHFHLVVAAPGHRSLVTEIFDIEDPNLDSDAVFGVREALIGRFEPLQDAAARARHGLPTSGSLVMSMQFRLTPA